MADRQTDLRHTDKLAADTDKLADRHTDGRQTDKLAANTDKLAADTQTS